MPISQRNKNISRINKHLQKLKILENSSKNDQKAAQTEENILKNLYRL